MKIYDCNKTLDFVHEYLRMCDNYKTCSDCPLWEYSRCEEINTINKDIIAIVDEWSDEHSE